MEANPTNLDVNPEVRARIIAAADDLFAANGKTAMPNVDAVRRKAHVNMNDATLVMRAWRRAQSASAAPITIAVPVRVHDACKTMLQTLWNEATELANTSLQAAQASWENERTEAEGSRVELSTAFDQQSAELQQLQRAHDELIQNHEREQRNAAGLAASLSAATFRAAQAESSATTAAARANDLQDHLADLRAELNRLHAQMEVTRHEAKQSIESTARELAKARTDLALTAELATRIKEENDSLKGQLRVTGEMVQSLVARTTVAARSVADKSNPTRKQRSPSRSKMPKGPDGQA